MKTSYQLLNEYIDLHGANPHEIAPAIAEHCFEVEFIREIGGQPEPEFTHVFAAEVLHVEKHPNADRLRVVKLNLGDKIIDPVVCGAFNFEAGDMVALALPGAHIPKNVHSDEHESFELGSAKIRGVESQGMICSGFELGLRAEPEEKPEIILLDAGIKPGTDLREYYSTKAKQSAQKDYLLDFAMPANRPDLHSHIGVAQELSGMLGYKKTKRMQQIQKDQAESKPLANTAKAKTKISIDHPACSLYLAARISVEVGPTPETLLAPLRTLGHNGVNNVVDITNFVMIETGQPSHAYDSAQVDDDITVRSAVKGEKVLALDGKEYAMPETAIIIGDAHKALGVAGIIGGDQSKITPETKEIILEVALFDRVAIRRTSKAIGLRTDASGLFEKGTVQQQAVFAFNRAVELLQEHANGKVVEIFSTPAPKAPKPTVIKFTAEEINGILGGQWSDTELKKILNGLGIETSGSQNLSAEIPWYRQDIEGVPGLADEIVRFIGMNLIPKQPLQLQRTAEQYSREDGIWNVKDEVAKLGYREVQGYSFMSAAEISATGRDLTEFIKVSNPLSSETEYLRHDLGEGLLKMTGANAKHTNSFKLFEVGFGYHGYSQEKLYLGMSIYRRGIPPEAMVAEMKGDLHALVRSLGIGGELNFRALEGNMIFFDLIKKDAGVQDLGAIAIIEPTNALAKRYDLDDDVALCQIQLDELITASAGQVPFTSYSRFPSSSLDISIVVGEGVQWGAVETIVRRNAGALLKSVKVIDAPYYYSKGTLPSFHKNLQKEGKKNLVFSLVFASATGTIQDSEISEIYAKIKADLETKLIAEIR